MRAVRSHGSGFSKVDVICDGVKGLGNRRGGLDEGNIREIPSYTFVIVIYLLSMRHPVSRAGFYIDHNSWKVLRLAIYSLYVRTFMPETISTYCLPHYPLKLGFRLSSTSNVCSLNLQRIESTGFLPARSNHRQAQGLSSLSRIDENPTTMSGASPFSRCY